MQKLCTYTHSAFGLCLHFAQQKWTEVKQETFNLVRNQGGQTIAYSSQFWGKVLTVDGFDFQGFEQKWQARYLRRLASTR